MPFPKSPAWTKNRLSGHEFLASVQTAHLDFFDRMPDRFTRRKGVVVLNPPYGKRLGNRTDTAAFCREILQKLAADFQGWRVGLVFPGRQFRHLNTLNLEPFPFFHGGLDLTTGIGRI